MAHYGVTCDGCGSRNFTGVRYKCQACFDYDLCHACIVNGTTSKQHQTSHAMKSIAAPGELDLYFGDSAARPTKKKEIEEDSASSSGEDVPEEEVDDEDEISPRDVLGTGVKTYTCPYCARIGYTEELLVAHVVTDHAEEDKPVVCPICAVRPGGNPNYVSRDFHGHIDLRHGGVRTKKKSTKGKGGIKKPSKVRGRQIRGSVPSELGLSQEKSRKDKRVKGEESSGAPFEQEKPEATQEEKEAQYHENMVRATFMQRMILSTLLPEDS